MYAQLCKRLSDSVSQFDGNAGNSSNQAGGPQTFLDVLSKVCWEKFENRFKYYQVGGEGPVNGEEAVLTADEEERQHVVKQKMLGNLKFIGELYLLGQLDDPIIHNCILQLLGNDKVSADLQVRCQDLECLCQLIRTCGKSLDAGPGLYLMDQYFHKMTKDSQKHQVYPPRIRFMLRDVIDLRADQWMPRTALSQQPGPMPIHLLRGSTKEDDDREAASTEHHHRMLSRGNNGGGGNNRDDPFGSNSPSRGGRDDRGALYGGRGSGGRDPMRGGDPMSTTDLFMSKIPGFNDMFNNLSLGTASTSSLLPPPPLMHNNRFLRDNNNGGGGGNKDGGDREYRGSGGYNDRRGGGEQRNNRDDYYHNKGGNGGGGGGGYRQNNNNTGGYGGGGRDNGNQYGGRGSNNYRDQQQQQQNSTSSDRQQNNGGNGGGGSYQRRGGDASGSYVTQGDDNDHRGARNDAGENNGYAGRNSREGGGGQRDGGSGGEGRNNYYNNTNSQNQRSTSPYNNNNRENGHRDYNSRDGGGGGFMNGGGGGYNNQQQNNNYRNNNNNNRNNNGPGGYNNQSNTTSTGGGNYQNNRYNNSNNKGAPAGQSNGGGGPMMGNNGPPKDLAPRFKRTMMGAGGAGGLGGQRENSSFLSERSGQGQGSANSGINTAMSSSTSSASSGNGAGENGTASTGVENVQMRPAANSLLFKANTMNVNKLPLSQPQQRVIPTNSMLEREKEKEKGVNNASGKDSSNGGGGSPFKGATVVVGVAANGGGASGGVLPVTERRKEGGGGLIVLGRGGVMAREQAEQQQKMAEEKEKEMSQAVDKQQQQLKKKKDKGASKEEVLKRFAAFLEETYFQQKVAVVEEEAGEKKEVEKEEEVEEKNAVDQLESEKKGEEGEEIIEKEEEKKEKVVVEEPVEKPKERDQTLAEIVAKYVDLKVPDKFVKDALTTLYALSVDREMREDGDTPPKALGQVVNENFDVSTAAWWLLSPVERAMVFVQALRQHQKLGNNVAESVRQTVQSVATDAPKQWPWVAKLVAVAVQCRVYGLGELAALSENGKYYPLMLDTLQRLSEAAGGEVEGRRRLVELFVAAKVDLLQVLPEGERSKEQLVAVLDARGLDYLCPLLRVQSQMWRQLQTDANPQVFYKWIKEHVDGAYFVEEGFIQALVTVLLKQITQESTLQEGTDQTKNPEKALIEKEKQALQKYSAVLNAFLTNKQLQLIAIYALQVYCHSVDFPKGMLLRWFTALYDLNVVEEEAFLQWKEDLSEAYPGKQRALFQVNAWLMWLQEAESEEEEEEDN